MMRFTKIGHDEKKTVLEWDAPAGQKDLIHSLLESGEQSRPEFDRAMDALLPEVLKLLELPEGYSTPDTHVTSLSLRHQTELGQPDTARGIVVTVRRPVKAANSPLMLHTPHLREVGEDESPVIAAIFKLVGAIEDEARLFIDGKRAQMDLFDGARTEAPAEEPAGAVAG